MTALYWTLGILAGLVFLSWLITRLNLEVDVATGERRLSRSSALGVYYDFITGDLISYRKKWSDLTTCTIGKRLLVCTLVGLVLAALVLVLFASTVFTAYWVVRYGFADPGKTVPWYISVGFALGGLVWVVGLLAGVGWTIAHGVIRLAGWWEDRRIETSVSGTRQESALVEAYRSAKAGVCHKVKVVE